MGARTHLVHGIQRDATHTRRVSDGSYDCLSHSSLDPRPACSEKRNVFGCRKSFGFVLKGFPPLFFLSAVLKSFSWCNQLKLSHRGHGICVRRRERHAWRPCLTDDQTEFRNLCILKWANRAPFLDGLGKMECHGAEQNYKLYIKKIWFGKQDVKISRNSCDFSEGSKLGCYGHTPTPHLLITYLLSHI